jgi:hypothetical protein
MYIWLIEIDKHTFPITVAKKKKIRFSIWFLLMLRCRLIQNKFYCANLMGRRWRTWNWNQITPAYLTNCLEPKSSNLSPLRLALESRLETKFKLNDAYWWDRGKEYCVQVYLSTIQHHHVDFFANSLLMTSSRMNHILKLILVSNELQK